jgi:hypothetical protein
LKCAIFGGGMKPRDIKVVGIINKGIFILTRRE